MSPVLEIEGLRKTYESWRRGRHIALDGLDMVVERGQVHGFLGPNGSGKTTTLRTLLGLVRASGGRMRVLGEPVPERLPAVASRVGAIVESPAFFGNYSGRRTLRLLARAGGVPQQRVDEVLDLVGMRARAGDRVKTYSLGMKQRLAVASALLKAPELLILDEPANGLDPAGIREMRDLLRMLAGTGTTVLISSHLLAEIQQICDSVTIIAGGRRVAAGPVGEVLAHGTQSSHRVRVASPDRALALLAAAGFAAQPEYGQPSGESLVVSLVVSGVDDPSRIAEVLGTGGLWVAELSPLVPDLEAAFLRLTAGPAVGTVLPGSGKIDLDVSR